MPERRVRVVLFLLWRFKQRLLLPFGTLGDHRHRHHCGVVGAELPAVHSAFRLQLLPPSNLLNTANHPCHVIAHMLMFSFLSVYS